MYKIAVFSPVEQKEDVKMAMFKAGGGKIGNYDCCCFETQGIGQFRPLDGSTPFIGEKDQISFVDEVRIEMVCEDSLVCGVLEAMKKAHPYETAAYDVWRLEDL